MKQQFKHTRKALLGSSIIIGATLASGAAAQVQAQSDNTGDTIESVTEYVRRTINDERVKISPYGENAWNPSPVSDVNSANFQNIEIS